MKLTLTGLSKLQRVNCFCKNYCWPANLHKMGKGQIPENLTLQPSTTNRFYNPKNYEAIVC